MDSTAHDATDRPVGHWLAEARAAAHLAQAHAADAVARTDAGNARAGLHAAKLARKAGIRASDAADAAERAQDPEEAEQARAVAVEAAATVRAARDYAQQVQQAELAPPAPEVQALDAAVEAAARAYYGAQDLLRPGDAGLQARLREAWDGGRVRPEVMADCRTAVRPLVVDALTAYRSASQ